MIVTPDPVESPRNCALYKGNDRLRASVSVLNAGAPKKDSWYIFPQ